MFDNELKQIEALVRAVDNLCNCSQDLNDARCDMDTCVNDFLNDESMLETDYADRVFNSMVRNERSLALNLEQFDLKLARVIAARKALGPVPVIL